MNDLALPELVWKRDIFPKDWSSLSGPSVQRGEC